MHRPPPFLVRNLPRIAVVLAVISPVAFLVLVLLAWPVVDAAPRLLDAWEGYEAFPVLADFATSRQELRWECRQAVLTRVPDAAQASGWGGHLEFLPGDEDYPGAELQPIVR